MAPEHEHQHITGENADDADCSHHMHVGIAEAGDHTAGNQGDVFGNRQAEAADHQDDENRDITILGECADQKIKHDGQPASRRRRRRLDPWLRQAMKFKRCEFLMGTSGF